MVKDGVTTPEDQIVAGVIRMVRNVIGPVASFKKSLVVRGLPKTRSRKVLRRVADGEEYAMPSTIEDPTVLDEIDEAVK